MRGESIQSLSGKFISLRIERLDSWQMLTGQEMSRSSGNQHLWEIGLSS